jgi:hypothetical protein
MPYGKPGEILCAVCLKRIRTTDKISRMETSNALAHTDCLRRESTDVDREHVRLVLFKSTRCLPCLAKTTGASQDRLQPLLEGFGPEMTTMAARCDDCGELGVVYTIR